MNKFLKSTLAAAVVASAATASFAQDVTLRVHHFMPEPSVLHANMLVPWAERLADASDGRIAMELFGSMALGGRPGDLYDQAVDGAVDIILTLPGYTAGRFPQTEVFELPFMMQNSVATSKAFWDKIESTLQDTDYEETHILAGWVHGPGVIHSKDPIQSVDDLAGKEMRGPTRLATEMLGELGATPVGMPLPGIPENLSKGVIRGAVVPWEIVPAIKLQELVGHHTEIAGDRALYTATFILAMNLDAYDDMPDDLRAILDAETGKILSEFAGTVQAAADEGGRASAVALGNTIATIEGAELDRWISAADPIYNRWMTMAAGQGFDGQQAIEEARALIAANQ
ncbi:MAG: TRAP transporter substrate-binding protein [Pseudomonadota bacterium]